MLVGSVEIPQHLPGLIETFLARGGSDQRPLSGLAALLPAEPAQPATLPSSPASADTPPFLRDMPANALAVVVQAGMTITVIWTVITWSRSIPTPTHRRDRLIPFLALAGLGVAAYLAYIETTGAQAVCVRLATVMLCSRANVHGCLASSRLASQVLSGMARS